MARPAMVTDEPLYVNNISNVVNDLFDPLSLVPPTPFRGEPSYTRDNREVIRDTRENRESALNSSRDTTGHNISSEFSGGRSSQSSTRSRSRVATKNLRRFWGRAADTGSMIL